MPQLRLQLRLQIPGSGSVSATVRVLWKLGGNVSCGTWLGSCVVTCLVELGLEVGWERVLWKLGAKNKTEAESNSAAVKRATPKSGRAAVRLQLWQC